MHPAVPSQSRQGLTSGTSGTPFWCGIAKGAGAGDVTVEAAPGVTVRAPEGRTVMDEEFGRMTLMQWPDGSFRLWNGTAVDVWVPTDLGVSLIAWWDADDLATITLEETTRVTVWTDKASGFAPDQDTGLPARPIYSATGFNGHPCITFDGINHHLSLENTGPLPIGAAPCEIWALVDQTALVADTIVRCVFAYGDSANGGRRLSRNVVTGVNRGRASTGTGAAQVNVTDTAIDLSGRHVMRARYDGTTTSIAVDAGAAVSAAAVPATLTTWCRIASNDGDPSGLRWQGSIAAILVTELLTTDQATALRAWLTARL